MTSGRLGFRYWTDGDPPLAAELWGDPEVTRLIGGFVTLGAAALFAGHHGKRSIAPSGRRSRGIAPSGPRTCIESCLTGSLSYTHRCNLPRARWAARYGQIRDLCQQVMGKFHQRFAFHQRRK
jgi:hypothetical protein